MLHGIEMATCSYREFRHDMGVGVATTVGRNRRFRGPEINALKPWSTFRKLDNAPVEVQEATYHQQLNDSQERVEREILAVSQRYPGTRLVFLCYDVLTGKGSYCHRTWLGHWLTDVYGVDVPELGKVRRPEPPAAEEPALL